MKRDRLISFASTRHRFHLARGGVGTTPSLARCLQLKRQKSTRNSCFLASESEHKPGLARIQYHLVFLFPPERFVIDDGTRDGTLTWRGCTTACAVALTFIQTSLWDLVETLSDNNIIVVNITRGGGGGGGCYCNAVRGVVRPGCDLVWTCECISVRLFKRHPLE